MTTSLPSADRLPAPRTRHLTVSAGLADRFRALVDRAAGARPGEAVPSASTVPVGLLAALALRVTGPLLDELTGPPAKDPAVALHGAQGLFLRRPVRCGEELVATAAVRSVKALGAGIAAETLVVLSADGTTVAEATSLLVRGAPVRTPAAAAAPAAPRPSGGQGTHQRASVFSVSRALVREYAELSGDHNPIHLFQDAAADAGFPDVVAHGMLTFALAARHLEHTAGENRLGGLNVRFVRPLLVGADHPAAVTVTERPAAGRAPETGEVLLSAHDRGGAAVATGRAVLRPPTGDAPSHSLLTRTDV